MDKQEKNFDSMVWEGIQKALYISDGREENGLRNLLINDIIDARKREGITQRQLESMSGVKQPIISRMERGATDPKLSTVLKILNSFGKTLQIVPLQEIEK
ncbi:MAG: helix-turn-helix domain-containing protein [Lachnospiraceae bacterium]|nr:helix-turn-helix domain-containing protein [Lachnospiraceae bacterium]